MIWIQNRFALSKQGAIDLIIGSLFCALQNIALFMPVGLIYSFIMHILIMISAYESKLNKNGAVFYISTGFVCMFILFFASWFQYNSTYFATYRESGIRRINLAERLRKIPLSFFSHKNLADITASIMNDCASLETSQSHFVAPLIGSIISTTLISLILFIIDWRMAFSVLWVLPCAFMIVGFSAKIQEKFSRYSMKTRISCEEGVQEYLEAFKDIKANNYVNEYISGLTKKIKSMEKSSMRAELGTAVFVVSAYLVLRLGIVTTAITGVYLFSHEKLDMITFILFLMTAARLYDPLEISLQNLAAIIATRSGIARMNEIYSQKIQSGKSTLTNKNNDIEFSHVSFSYDDKQIIHDVSFTAKHGQVTALAGPSGGGKTTITRLLLRFWDINSGKISIGGMNISEIDPEKLMSLYSIVFQDVILFNNSVIENIRIGRKNASIEEIKNAAKLANCEEFIEKLPNKWDTLIGENGCELSGGERQRISIARAFLKNAPIILLDEATASLDVENETKIQSALTKLIKNKTVIVIAHRMRTIMEADKLIIISDGKISKQGKPEEILNNHE